MSQWFTPTSIISKSQLFIFSLDNLPEDSSGAMAMFGKVLEPVGYMQTVRWVFLFDMIIHIVAMQTYCYIQTVFCLFLGGAKPGVSLLTCCAQGLGPGHLFLSWWQCYTRGDWAGQEELGPHRPGAGSNELRPAEGPGGPSAGERPGCGVLPAGHCGEKTLRPHKHNFMCKVV